MITIEVVEGVMQGLFNILKEMKLSMTEEEYRDYRRKIDEGDYFFMDFAKVLNIVARKLLETDIED